VRGINERSRGKKQIPVRVHLLHGTWATGAPWTKSASKLVTALREIAETSPIEWKGKNRDTDRRSAAEQVIDTLHQQQGRQILIAHSHGGNVAVYAAADARLRGKVAGIVCMNTPFISVIRHDYTTRLALVSMLAVVAPLIWAMGVLLNGVEGIFFELTLVLGVGFVIALVVGSVVPVVRYFQRRGAVVWNRLAPTHVADVPVLCISSGDDEAQYGLSLLDHLANLPTVLQHPLVMIALFFGFLGMLSPECSPKSPFLASVPGRSFLFSSMCLAFFSCYSCARSSSLLSPGELHWV
jgi:pimeloyl-ACP methyl ester carboxylesterase